MKVKDLINIEGMELIAGKDGVDRNIKGVYLCDLLSWVMSNASKDDIWITVQTHTNIIAVASLLEIACIIIPDDIELEQATAQKANEEGIPVFSTGKPAYEIAKLLAKLEMEA